MKQNFKPSFLLQQLGRPRFASKLFYLLNFILSIFKVGISITSNSIGYQDDKCEDSVQCLNHYIYLVIICF